MKLFITVAVLLSSVRMSAQEGIVPTLGRLQGIWEGVIEEDISEFYIINGNRCILVIASHDKSSVFGRPFSYLGFWSNDGPHDLSTPGHISELQVTGQQLLFYDYLGINYNDFGGLIDNSRTCFVTMNENEMPTDTIPKYFHLSCGRSPDAFGKIDYLPLAVLRKLKANVEDWKKYKSFVSDIPKTERLVVEDKTFIFSEPDVTTKMYLIKNDVVEVLEETKEWLLVRFIGNTVVDGWIRKSATKVKA